MPSTRGSPGGPLIDLGVQPSFLTTVQLNAVLDDARSAGAKVISTAASWSSMRPDPAQPYIWNLMDEVVNGALARGMQVRLQAQTLPVWARDPGAPSDYWVPPRSPAERARFAGFVSDLAAHYRSKVAYIEVWNEPNISQFWSTGPNPTQFAALLAATYPAIKIASPSTTVISGGLSRNDVGFAGAMYRALAALGGTTTNHFFFDMLGAHPYSGDRGPSVVLKQWDYTGPFGEMDENFTGFTRLLAVMTDHGEPLKRIYIGEYGFSTIAWESFAAVSDTLRGTYLTQAYSIASQNPSVYAMSWFYLLTTPWDGPGFALLDANLRPSATYNALVAYARSRGLG